MQEIQTYLEFAIHLADVGAQVIRQYYRTGLAADTKSDGSPVTMADKKTEEAMRARIMQAFPAHGILGEEFGPHQPEAAYQWTLDPIDGTKNFIAGSFLFGTLIGLLKDGQPILGVLNHPINNQLLTGAAGETRLNGKRVHVRPCARIEDATLLNTTHWGVAKHHDMAAYEALTRRVKVYRTWGDCHGYYLIASGYADIMLDPVMEVWDVAPLVPIVEGAGGRVTDWYGDAVIGGRGAVATAGQIHEAVLRALAGQNED